MKKLLLLSSLFVLTSIGLQDISAGHGGTYRGPGDTVPPGGGGGGAGGGSTPGPVAPSGPGSAGGSTPSPTGPGLSGPGNPSRPTTGGAAVGQDLTLWQFWWGFNKANYLSLKSHIQRMAAETGSDEYFLGHGQRAGAGDNLAPTESTIRGVIVPALVHALKTEHHNDILTGAMIALAKIGDEQAEDGSSSFEQLFLPFLQASSQEVAETAAISLGILGNPESIGTLRALLLDEPLGRQLVACEAGVNYRTRAFAAYGLGQIGYRTESLAVRQKIVDMLWEVCESPRARTRDVKVAALIAMGLVPLDLAVGAGPFKLLEHAAAPRNRQQQIEYLLAFFASEKDKNKHYLVRAHAPRAICRLMDGVADESVKTHVVEVLAPYVTKRGNVGVRELRQSAALAFGMLGDLDNDPSDVLIRERLVESARNADAQVKNFSVIAMGQVGGRPGGGEFPMAGAGSVRKYLLTQLSRGKTQTKPWAGLAIGVMERGLVDNGQLQSSESLAALSQALRDTRTKNEVGAYAIACGIAGNSDAEGVLLEKLDRMADDEVRGHLAIGLGLMASGAAIEPIQKIVEDSEYRGELLKQAAIALGLMGDKNLVGNLVEMLGQAKTLSTRAAIASALGFIGDSTSVTPLVEMLGDSSVTGAARGFAAAALGIVADKEALPWNSKFSTDINYRANTSTLTDPAGNGLLDIL